MVRCVICPHNHEVIHLLQYLGDIALLIDHFVEFISPLSLMKKQAILIVNELVRGTAIIGNK